MNNLVEKNIVHHDIFNLVIIYESVIKPLMMEYVKSHFLIISADLILGIA